MALERRLINVTLQLGEGEYGEGGFDTVELSGLRVQARIQKAGGASMGTASLRIYGVKQSIMDKIGTLGLRPTTQRKNLASLTAGVKGNMAVVFDGTINNAYGDYQSAPEVPLIITAQTGLFENKKPVPASSYRGNVDVATILQSVANLMGKRFENNGVSVKLFNPYLPGTAREQALKVVRDAGINWNGLDEGVLAIWPAGKTRGGTIPRIAPDSGMVGFPVFTPTGIIVKTLFDPALGLGRMIKVESSVKGAAGEWGVNTLDYELDSMTPHGSWFAVINASPPGYQPVVR